MAPPVTSCPATLQSKGLNTCPVQTLLLSTFFPFSAFVAICFRLPAFLTLLLSLPLNNGAIDVSSIQIWVEIGVLHIIFMTLFLSACAVECFAYLFVGQVANIHHPFYFGVTGCGTVCCRNSLNIIWVVCWLTVELSFINELYIIIYITSRWGWRLGGWGWSAVVDGWRGGGVSDDVDNQQHALCELTVLGYLKWTPFRTHWNRDFSHLHEVN